MYLGSPPHYSHNKLEMCKKIMNHQIILKSSDISNPVVLDFISKLLTIDVIVLIFLIIIFFSPKKDWEETEHQK